MFTKCAQVVPLGGGKKDVEPPKLLLSIPQLNATNFNSNEIILQFDEYIQLKNASAVYINPKIKTKPDVVSEGKKLKIKINSNELEPNTTYKINFGSCIVDAREGNKLENFFYVFSTGSFIDTLSLKGIITNAYDNSATQNITVGLFDKNLQTDSAVFKLTPLYYTYSDAAGNYIIKNLPKKEFSVVAFDDKNKNLLYDGESEKIAFASENLNLNRDSSLDLKLFQEVPTKNYIKKIQSPYRGFSYIVLNKKSEISITPLNFSNDSYVLNYSNSKYDTLNIYYKTTSDTLCFIAKVKDKVQNDTIQVVCPKNNKLNKKTFAPNFNFNSNLPQTNIIELNFNNWVDTLKFKNDGLKLYYKKDSLKTLITKKVVWVNPTKLKLEFNYELDKEYVLQLDTCVFYNYYGNSNDSLKTNFKKKDITSFGKLTLNTLLNLKTPYIVQLINSKNNLVAESYIETSLSGSNNKVSKFDYLEPDTYTVKIIIDENKNKNWDTGDYLKKIQPERVEMITKQIKIVSDWEIEEEIILKK